MQNVKLAEVIDKRLNKKLIVNGMVGGTVRDEGKAGWDWNWRLNQQKIEFSGKMCLICHEKPVRACSWNSEVIQSSMSYSL